MLLTVVAFLVALGVLIAVHEYGHYRVARACGVKVLRFSIGFGRPIARWQRPGSPTEFVIGVLPLGGYVRMLDEREAPVDAAERSLAFNTQPLRARAAIVAAGPLANLLLAVVLYAAVNWMGVQEPAAFVSRPAAQSVAERAGLRSGDQVLAAAVGAREAEPVRSFDALRWTLTQAALNAEDVRLQVRSARAGERSLLLPLSQFDAREADAGLLARIGVVAPWARPVLGEIGADGAAARAGLAPGDLVLSIDGAPVEDARQLRDAIRASAAEGGVEAQRWRVERVGREMALEVTPEPHQEGAARVGRINAYVGAPPRMVRVAYGPLEGLSRAFVRTWDVSVLSLRMLGRMLVGEASLKNLSGPLTIADYAGRSASLGLAQYLAFMALISVSLGVLNLLPLPVLDGGHLMYYLWEAVTGHPPSDVWMERLTRGGVALLVLMMSIAVFNDFTRLFG